MAYGVNAPQGLVGQQYLANATWNGAFQNFPVASGYGTSLFKGDPTTDLADGTIGIGVAGATCNGVFQGVSYTNATGSFIVSPFWLAGTVTLGTIPATAQVVADPNAIFEIQTNSGVGLALTDVNSNANFVAGAGNQRTGLSGYMLDQATLGVGGNLNLKIIALGTDIRNAPLQPYNTALVYINNHRYKPGTAGI